MSGERLFLDTNAIIALLRGDGALVERCNLAAWVGVSVISILEFLSFDELQDADRQLLWEFVGDVHVIQLDSGQRALIARTAEIRTRTRVKLPDAIIIASAAENRATLVTNDRDLFAVKMVPVSAF